MKYTYHINLDERGTFDADVRDESGKSVYELHAEDEPLEQVEDGFMRHTKDIAGLGAYLLDLGIVKESDTLEHA